MSTLTTQQKSAVDKLWAEFWTGGISNPLTAIEQISFLMFVRLLDVAETTAETKAARTKKPLRGRFDGKLDPRRWSNFKQIADGAKMLVVVRDQVFPHLRELGGFMSDAQLMIQKPSLLVSAVSQIDALPITTGDAKGDLYEYLLSKLTTAGINGQFRTPRHIIRFMVDMLAPEPDEVIGDPACGTAGFLVGVMLYLYEKYAPDGGTKKGNGEKLVRTGKGLEDFRAHIQRGLLHGFDFDSTMLRIASMNLMLHGVDEPAIHYQDTLSSSFPERFPKQASGTFDVILANPPFKGSLDEEDVHPSLTRAVKTKKTELLFVALVLRMLKQGGRSATIVPDGVLFGSSKAHKSLRRLLVEENQLDGVISLPSGVFKPYAGVSTAILVFSKGGKTEQVFFYDVQADGYSLDDKRDKVNEDDLPEALKKWRTRGKGAASDRTKKHFVVPVSEIVANGYDLSINRYKEVVHEEVQYEAPGVIIGRLRELEKEIAKELGELEGML